LTLPFEKRAQILTDIEKRRLGFAGMAMPATVKEASFLLNVSERSVTKYCLVKGLGTRIGSVWLVDIKQLIDSAAGTGGRRPTG